MATDVEIFNQDMSKRYQGIRDYIVCHYKVNSRTDTPYWQDVKHTIPISDNLQSVIETWDAGKDITPVLQQRGMDKYYPAVSWYCLLAGYGRFNSANLNNEKLAHSQAMHTFKQV
jgi:hypothetical protein